MKNRNKKSGKFFKKYFSYPEKSKQFNMHLFIGVLLLSFFGLIILFSSSAYLTIKNNTSQFYYVARQGVFCLIGIVLMIFVSKINYRIYYDHAPFIYIITVILLLLVYFPPTAVTINSASRAINLGITFMPSDVAKLGATIFLAYYLVKKRNKMENLLEGLILPAIIIVIPFLLILFQTDLSTSIVVITSLGLVYLVGGFRAKYMPLVLVSGGLFVLLMYLGLEDYQKNRITAFLNPEDHYNDLSWQVLNGLFAVSRGGLSGQGFGKSIYKHGYLATEVNNDMIFAVIAEEFGFIGSVLFLLLVLFITYQLFKISFKSKDLFGKLLVLGIGLVYFIQTMINLGVSMSIIPNTGINLPFVSNGGTSLVMFFIMFGVALNVSRFNNKDEKARINRNGIYFNKNSFKKS